MVASLSRSAELGAVDSPTRPSRLSAAKMYARVLAGDPAWNGRFFTGVLTTGIYCLPSCKARKPNPENVRFFPTCAAARAAGLRPCRKCHPDDYARGADPVLEAVERVVAEVRENPAAFADARSLVQRLGFGTTRSFELFRLHYHRTPADLLTRARIARAQQLLLEPAALTSPRSPRGPARGSATPSVLEISAAVGFENVSVFHEHFRSLTGLTPASYRELRDTRTFEIALPAGYALGYLRRALSRDARSANERLQGDVYTAAVRLATGPAQLTLQLSPASIRVDIEPETDASNANPLTSAGVEAHAIVAGLLGLDDDATGFSRLARKLGLGRLVAGREQLRISRTQSVFEGLLWAIIGQQINFGFACVLKRRLFERAGVPLANGLIAPPTPAAVAALRPADLVPLQFSKQKAAYLIDTAARIDRGDLDLSSLAGLSATRAERTLLGVRGLGPWSVHYIMMRGLGFADCVPLGDTGVTSALQQLMSLEQRPDVDATRRLMAVFSPYRSLATSHLWQLGQPIPE